MGARAVREGSARKRAGCGGGGSGGVRARPRTTDLPEGTVGGQGILGGPIHGPRGAPHDDELGADATRSRTARIARRYHIVLINSREESARIELATWLHPERAVAGRCDGKCAARAIVAFIVHGEPVVAGRKVERNVHLIVGAGEETRAGRNDARRDVLKLHRAETLTEAHG